MDEFVITHFFYGTFYAIVSCSFQYQYEKQLELYIVLVLYSLVLVVLYTGETSD